MATKTQDDRPDVPLTMEYGDMPVAFLLNFEETCDFNQTGSFVQATTTKTSVAREASDVDKGSNPHAAATQTKTLVRNEQSDTDCSNQAQAIPRHPVVMGTQTITEVRTEPADTDPSRQRYQMIERC